MAEDGKGDKLSVCGGFVLIAGTNGKEMIRVGLCEFSTGAGGGLNQVELGIWVTGAVGKLRGIERRPR